MNQAEYVFDGGVQVIDHVVHYENIQKDFDDLMEMYGLDLRLPNKKKHGVNTREKKSTLTYLDLFPETIEVINRYAANDFHKFGYEMVDSFDNDGSYSFSAVSR